MKHSVILSKVLLIGALAAAPALAQSSGPEEQPAQPMTAPAPDSSASAPVPQNGGHHLRRNRLHHSHRGRSATQPAVGGEPNSAAAAPNAGAAPNSAGQDEPPAPNNQ
jgi:hypothetical protein